MTRKMMIVLVAMVFACLSVSLFASCAKKQVKVEEEVTAPPPAVEEGREAEEARRRAEMEARERAEEQRRAMEMREQLQREISMFESERIYFDFDKSELKPEARAVLRKKAEWLKENSEFSLRVEGHCDERGTNEYNLALGERRADAAWRFLNALGISGERLSTISFGEEQPADPRHNEEAWAKNRRDEFKLLR